MCVNLNQVAPTEIPQVMSWSAFHEKEIKNNLYKARLQTVRVHSLNDLMIAVTLSYVPVAKPNTPISTIITSFVIVKTLRLVLCQQTIMSIIGGKTRASAVLLTAPTKDMKRPNFGIASARITKIIALESKHAYVYMYKIRSQQYKKKKIKGKNF